jgi:hypothetical protein
VCTCSPSAHYGRLFFYHLSGNIHFYIISALYDVFVLFHFCIIWFFTFKSLLHYMACFCFPLLHYMSSCFNNLALYYVFCIISCFPILHYMFCFLSLLHSVTFFLLFCFSILHCFVCIIVALYDLFSCFFLKILNYFLFVIIVAFCDLFFDLFFNFAFLVVIIFALFLHHSVTCFIKV